MTLAKVIDKDVEIGDRVRDKLTGFVGIAYGRWECMTGCVIFDVYPPMKEDGTVPDSKWVDEARCEVLEEQAVTVTIKAREPAGPCSLNPPTDGPR